ncbi:MAG TPA: SprT family zinc-dependent metalloprotease [Deltaproteobacteria bacterium]|jgi:hypothetical protein|nr:SprT family zinc-dependent metalloprotease [Deltaproteobacteria bacterium]HOI06890.1 SprT family zinc-dependent metalloprotease [Deltaproteobacteria bacterium]
MEVNIEGAGTVVMEHSGRAKRMRITVRPGSVRVSLPRGVSYAQGKAFVKGHADWIRVHLERMRSREEAGRELLAGLPPLGDVGQARSKLIFRCRLLAMETGLACSRITVRSQKTRWGSCSAANAISLNIQLARLPGHLMDYVILHELVHTRIRGHGRDFWQELERYVADARALRAELRSYPLEAMCGSGTVAPGS